MRILVTSDLHYRLPALDWLLDACPGYDSVVIAGDLLNVASPVPIEAQIVVIDSYLERMAQSVTVLVASGNHDLDGPDVHGEQIASWLRRSRPEGMYTDEQSVDLGDVRITLCPWWDGPVTRELLDRQLATAAVGRPAWWIWVYHSPPAGTPLCFDGRRTFADNDLAGWIADYAPEIVLCGHIHQAPWADGGDWQAQLGESWVFNAGQAYAATPAHIVVDTDDATATWYGLVGQEPARVELRHVSAQRIAD